MVLCVLQINSMFFCSRWHSFKIGQVFSVQHGNLQIAPWGLQCLGIVWLTSVKRHKYPSCTGKFKVMIFGTSANHLSPWNMAVIDNLAVILPIGINLRPFSNITKTAYLLSSTPTPLQLIPDETSRPSFVACTLGYTSTLSITLLY